MNLSPRLVKKPTPPQGVQTEQTLAGEIELSPAEAQKALEEAVRKVMFGSSQPPTKMRL